MNRHEFDALGNAELDQQIVRRENYDRRSDWPEPKPLPNGLVPVPPFRLEFLPESIAPFVGDVSDRMQCPPEFVAIAALVSLGSVLGRKIGIRPQQETSWTEVANVWGCVIGRPGVMKSPAINEVLKLLKRLEAKAVKENARAFATFEAEYRAYKIKRSALERNAKKAVANGEEISDALLSLQEPQRPKSKRYLVNDATYEALGEIYRTT